jgi:oxaloacetate decarboxylase
MRWLANLPKSARTLEVGMFSGSIGSMSVLGSPDLVVLTLTEFAGQANRICRAGNLALLVDADHGYGNALNVRRTVEELETAGICAMSIEDTVPPRPYGASGKPSLSSVDEGVGKMRHDHRAGTRAHRLGRKERHAAPRYQLG